MAEQHSQLEVWLGRYGGERRFVLRNVGDRSIFDVDFVIEPEAGKNSPVVSGEHEKKFPVGELEAGDERTLQAIITTGTGLRFTGEVTWRNEDGTRGRLSVPFAV